MADAERFVDFRSVANGGLGADTNAGNSEEAPWLTLSKAISGHGLSFDDNDTYTIKIINGDYGGHAVYQSASYGIKIWEASGGLNGVNVIIDKLDYSSPKYQIGYEQIIKADVTSGSLTLRNCDFSCASGSRYNMIIMENANRSASGYSITFEDCIINAADKWLFVDLTTAVNVGNAGGYTMRRCTVSDCRELLYTPYAISIGGVTMESNDITMGGVTDTTLSWLSSSVVATLHSIIFRNNTVACTAGAGAYAQSLVYVANWTPTGHEVLIVDGNDVTITAGQENANGWITVFEVDGIRHGGTGELLVSVCDNKITLRTSEAFVRLGKIVDGTRQDIYDAATFGKDWGGVTISNNDVVNSGTSVGSGVIYLGIGPNNARVIGNFGFGNGHSLACACDDVVIQYNIIYGFVPLLMSGDGLVVRHNTILGPVGSSGGTVGAPSGYSWEAPERLVIERNIFASYDTETTCHALQYSYNAATMTGISDKNCFWAPSGAVMVKFDTATANDIATVQSLWGFWSNSYGEYMENNDANSIEQDPKFVNLGGNKREDYIPRNPALTLSADPGDFCGAFASMCVGGSGGGTNEMILASGQQNVTTYVTLRDESTHEPKTDVTVTAIDLYYVKEGSAISSKVDATALSAATDAHTDNYAYNIGQGVYRIDWPDAAFTGSAKSNVKLIVVCSGCDTEFIDVLLSPTAGVDWGSVENAGATHNLSGTTVNLVNQVTTLTGTVALSATGLDAIPVTAPTGVATTFREMIVQTWRRFFKKATMTSTTLTTFADNGSSALTTQTVSDDGTTQTQGVSS